MSKEKKRKTNENGGILVSEEARNVLLGLMIFLLCFIAFFERSGTLGNIVHYIFVYIFGVGFIFPLLFIMGIGVYLFFKRKLPSFKIGVVSLAFVLLIMFMLIASSENNLQLGEVLKEYNIRFNLVVGSSFNVLPSFDSVGGGIIGFYAYSLLRNIAGDTGAKLITYLGVFSCLFLILRPFIYFIGKKINDRHPSNSSREKNKKYKTKEVKIVPIDEEQLFGVINEDPHLFKTPNSAFTKKNSVMDEQLNHVIVKDVNSNFGNNTNKTTTTKEEFNVFSSTILKEEPLSFTTELKKNEKEFDIFSRSLFQPSKTIEKEVSLSSYSEENVQTVNDITDIDDLALKIAPSPIKNVSEKWEEVTVVEEVKNFNKENEFIPVKPPLPSPFQKEIHYDDEMLEPTKKEVSQTFGKPLIIEENQVRIEKKKSANYLKPSLSLLDDVKFADDNENRMQAELNCVILNQKLESLGIRGRVKQFIISPAFTRFEIQVSNDVKVSQFHNIKSDLMMALAAEKINVLAPIPGTQFVGIDVANKLRRSVAIKEILQCLPLNDDNLPLLVGLGQDIKREPISIKINETPHLLVAGTTGSGKSVCINTILLSLLFHNSPDRVKLILVDPKRVELSMYNDLPHLLCPVITDSRKASIALKKVVELMDDRYGMLEISSCKNIEGYNALMKSRGNPLLPYIVVIIDELADLMLIAAKEVEESIQRITQLARAAGIHLVVATQRPSVDVITGVIKSNIPSRIAFSVSSGIDSRTILDENGAEELLGKGDMLISLTGKSIIRAQGAFVSDDELLRVLQFIKNQTSPIFDPNFLQLEPVKTSIEGIDGEMEEKDHELFKLITGYLHQYEYISATLIQRKHNIGYPRAMRMLDYLVASGYISEENTSKGREVLKIEVDKNDRI